MSTVTEQFHELCKSGIVAGPPLTSQIIEAEAVLEVAFPDQYRTFLQEYGAVVAQCIEIYGVIDPVKNDPPMWHHVVETALKLRAWRQSGSENKNFIPISDDGMGVYFYIDASSGSSAEVWAIGPGIEQVVASNLYEFAISYSCGKLAM